MIDIAEQIKSQINMRDILNKYGIELNRQGFAKCPFHGEKTASFKLFANDTKYKCFGCGKSGDVISFVKEYFNLDFKQAIERINVDFGLMLPIHGKIDYRAEQRARQLLAQRKAKQTEINKQKQALQDEYIQAFNKYHKCVRDITLYKPLTQDEPLKAEYVRAVHNIDLAEFEMNIALDRLDEFCKVNIGI